MLQFVSHHNGECTQFFDDYLLEDKKVLFIGTLGFNDLCLYFPEVLSKRPNVDYVFLIEERAEVSQILRDIAKRNREVLEGFLKERHMRFIEVPIVADDTAIVAGRSAAVAGRAALVNGYTDVLIDATSMSRGVCFPIVKQAVEYAARLKQTQTHILVASRTHSNVKATSMSSDAPQYMHGFQGDMNLDHSEGAIKLWVPQLAEGTTTSLERIHRALNPDESCPILPFPSASPRRGDMLLREFKGPLLNDWGVNLLDLIYAHESDPNDVCATIGRIHSARHEALSRAIGQSNPDRTVLSPAGTRVGSIGMLLASLQLDLPIMYEESIGYTSDLTAIPALTEASPDHLWHVWLRP